MIQKGSAERIDSAIQRIRWAVERRRATAGAILLCTSTVVLVTGAAVAVGPSGAWSAEPEIVARVNGDPVTRGEVQRLLADPRLRRQLQQGPGGRKLDSKELERWALRTLIIRRLFLQEAGRRNVTVTEQDLDPAVAAVRRRSKDPKRFQAWLQSRGLDEKSLRETIRAEMLIRRVRVALVEEVRLTDAQVHEYYAAHKADLNTAEEVRLRIIAVKDRATADEIVAALQKGEEFDRLARERSVGFGGAQGGDGGWVGLQTLPPPLREVVGTLKVGETGGPLPKGARFLIVRLEERRPARPKSLAEARPEIERRLLPAKQQEVLRAWLTEQGKTSRIEGHPFSRVSRHSGAP